MGDADLIREQAWLISRGVRPLALLESTSGDEKEMQKAFLALCETHGGGRENAIPFVIPRGDFPAAARGFASHEWVIELLKWTYGNAPERWKHCILGLLLGYSAEAISDHDTRMFAGDPGEPSSQSTSNSPPRHSRCTE